MDVGTTIVLCTLIVCLMAPIVIDSIGDMGAFKMNRKNDRSEENKMGKQEKER